MFSGFKSVPQAHKGFNVSIKPYLNLCLFKWLGISSLIPSGTKNKKWHIY